MHSENIHGAADLPEISMSQAAKATLVLNPSLYAADLKGLDISSADEKELLATLWSIMFSIVEMGFSVDICGLLEPDFNHASDPNSAHGILPSSTIKDTRSDGTESQ